MFFFPVDLCDYSSDSPLTLVPYLDFVNHSSTPNALCKYEETNRSFVLESTQDICEGEEIFINYGNNTKTNNSLIFLYGFASKFIKFLIYIFFELINILFSYLNINLKL